MRDETRTRNTSYQDNVSAEGIAKCQVLGNSTKLRLLAAGMDDEISTGKAKF
jgi:hypothetical protein